MSEDIKKIKIMAIEANCKEDKIDRAELVACHDRNATWVSWTPRYDG